jgi:hypothetical protein
MIGVDAWANTAMIFNSEACTVPCKTAKRTTNRYLQVINSLLIFDAMQTYVVIVAGGAGKRMGSVLPKQFLLLKNKPVLYYTIDAFLKKALPDCKVIVVLPEEHLELGKEIIDGFFDEQRIQLTVGGEHVSHSVLNGIEADRRRVDHFCA